MAQTVSLTGNEPSIDCLQDVQSHSQLYVDNHAVESGK